MDALSALRAGGYRPRAWLRFVGASPERSAQNRRARPEMTAPAIAGRRPGRVPALSAWALHNRHAAGVALAFAAVFVRARRPAITARRAGGAARVGGLAVGAAGAPRLGTALVLVGCATPPRSTARHLSLA